LIAASLETANALSANGTHATAPRELRQLVEQAETIAARVVELAEYTRPEFEGLADLMLASAGQLADALLAIDSPCDPTPAEIEQLESAAATFGELAGVAVGLCLALAAPDHAQARAALDRLLKGQSVDRLSATRSQGVRRARTRP
jgi:hypothetical protein